MAIYWMLLLLTYLCYAVSRALGKRNTKKNQFFLASSGLAAILVMGLRSSTVGVDTWQFYGNFNAIRLLNWNDIGNTRYEYGYFILNKLVGVFTDNAQVFLFVCAIITIVCTYCAIYLLSDNILLSVTIFQTFGFFCNSISLLRQFLAVSVLLISYYFFLNKKYRKMVFTVCIASLFHASALFFLAIYFFLWATQQLNKFRYIITIAVTATIPIVYKIIITIVPRYQFYLTYQSSNYVSKGLLVIFLMGAIILPFILKKNDSKLYEDYSIGYLIQLLIIGIMLNLLANSIPMLGRIIHMFTLFLIFYLPKMLSLLNNKNSKKIIEIVILMAQLAYYYNFLANAVGSVCPYIFFWE